MQTTAEIILVRPRKFRVDSECAADNFYQHVPEADKEEGIDARVYAESGALADCLRAKGVNVHLIEDDLDLPDSVFPNNFFSAHGLAGLTVSSASGRELLVRLGARTRAWLG